MILSLAVDVFVESVQSSYYYEKFTFIFFFKQDDDWGNIKIKSVSIYTVFALDIYNGLDVFYT